MILGFVYHGFQDAIREGDGDRIMVYWKLLLLAFKASNRRNYAKEAFLTLLQSLTLPPRLRQQLKWSRCVNTSGKEGKNVPCDLAMEHLNRRLKTVLSNAGADINPPSILRAAKSIGVVSSVCQEFEDSVHAHRERDRHSDVDDARDFQAVLEIVQENKVVLYQKERQHSAFTIKSGIFEMNTECDFRKWIVKLLREEKLGLFNVEIDI